MNRSWTPLCYSSKSMDLECFPSRLENISRSSNHLYNFGVFGKCLDLSMWESNKFPTLPPGKTVRSWSPVELETFLCLPLAEPLVPLIALPSLQVRPLVPPLPLWAAGSIKISIERRFGVAEKWGGGRRGSIPMGGPHPSIEGVNTAWGCYGCGYQGLNLEDKEENHSMGLADGLIKLAWDGTKAPKFGVGCKR